VRVVVAVWISCCPVLQGVRATCAAVSPAERQSAALKRLIDQSRVDASKTQEMLAQVCMGDWYYSVGSTVRSPPVLQAVRVYAVRQPKPHRDFREDLGL
jgi:hypothetical protein